MAAAETAGCEGVALRVGLHQGGELARRGGGHLRVDDEQQRPLRHHADRGEVLHRVVLHALLVEQRVDGMDRRIDVERVAIGRCTGNVGGTDHARRARAVVDDDVLLELRAQLLGQKAADRIDRPAGSVRHDQRDGLAGPGLLCQRARGYSGGAECGDRGAENKGCLAAVLRERDHEGFSVDVRK